MQPRKSLVKRKIEQPVEIEDTSSDIGAPSLLAVSVALAASRVTELAPLQGLLPDGEDDNFISFGKVNGGRAVSSSSSSSDGGGSLADDDAGPGGYESDRSEIPERKDEEEEGVTSPTSAIASPTTRDNFSGVVFEQRVAVDVREAHLTLLTLPSPLTIQGPCGLYGIGGETSINGYLIGSKRLLLPTKYDRATAAPVKRLGTKASEGSTPLHKETDPETVFGVVNWAWVRERLESWQRRNPVQMSILLVIQHRDVTTKQWFEKGPSSSNAREVPSFISNYRYLATPQPVLEAISTVAKQRSAVVAVVGEKDVGKSTMCRMVSNALLSQHGTCYWVDLDLGQPEFGVPGCLSVVKILMPITTEAIPADSWALEKNIFLGTTHISCPITYAIAVATLTRHIKEKGLYPCVINTHGWVESTGRRGTLECLRRLKATFIVHLGKTGGADMDWSTGRVIGDPTMGINSTMSEARFWNGTASSACAMPDPENQLSQFRCRIQQVELGNPKRTAGKRDREEDNGSDSDDSVAGERRKQQQQQQYAADATVFRIVADYVARPKGDNIKRRRAKWLDYFSPLLNDNVEGRSVVTLELSKLRFVAVAATDEKTAAKYSRTAVTELLQDSIVSLSVVEDDMGVGASKSANNNKYARLLNTFSTSPSSLCFGVVVRQGANGTVEVSIPRNEEFVASTLAVLKGRIGLVISPDRGDYGPVLHKITVTEQRSK